MRYNIFVLLTANNDLHDIHEYLSDFGENTQKKFRESFEKYVEQVSDMPYIFSEYERNPIYRRAMLEYGYLVFYRVDKKRKEVKIYRVLNSRQNIADLI